MTSRCTSRKEESDIYEERIANDFELLDAMSEETDDEAKDFEKRETKEVHSHNGNSHGCENDSLVQDRGGGCEEDCSYQNVERIESSETSDSTVRSIDTPFKPFEKTSKSFDSSFDPSDSSSKPFEQVIKPFNAPFRSSEQLTVKPFKTSPSSFESSVKPFDLSTKTLKVLPKSFEASIKPFDLSNDRILATQSSDKSANLPEHTVNNCDVPPTVPTARVEPHAHQCVEQNSSQEEQKRPSVNELAERLSNFDAEMSSQLSIMSKVLQNKVMSIYIFF